MTKNRKIESSPTKKVVSADASCPQPPMKLPGFPTEKPGEMFSSVVARYLTRSSTPKTFHLRSLGLNISRASSVIHRDLSHFASIMPSGHTWQDAPEVIAKGHTLVPLFLHFAHPKRAATAIDIMISGKRRPSLILGATISAPKSLHIAAKFCPDCLVHDLRAFGFPVLYRQHQPQFVNMCSVHARTLRFNCLHCQNDRDSVGMWQMAGRCDCSQPNTPPLLQADVDPKTEEAWLWLARQVATILSAPDVMPSVSVAANLVAALKSVNFSLPNGGLDPKAMTGALVDRFGEPFLRQVGVGAWCDHLGRRPNQVLTARVIEGRAVPSALRALLLVRLVTDDIASLWRSAPEPVQKPDYQPVGYGRRPRINSTHLEEEAIVSAIDAADGKITAAARSLDMTTSALAREVRNRRIHLPLAATTAKRLGSKRITAIRKALVEGIPKIEIRKQYGISEWTILRIELDWTGLGDAHRKATVGLQKKKHRTALQSFFRSNPGESRRTFAIRHAGTYDWLQRYDRDWLSTHLPKPAFSGPKSPRRVLNDWHALDQIAASVVRDAARREFAKSGRPFRLTRMRLLSAAGATVAMSPSKRYRYPTAAAEAERLAETTDQFVRRTICWTLEELARQHLVISATRVWRVSSLRYSKVLEYRDYIKELAADLELPFHARCAPALSH